MLQELRKLSKSWVSSVFLFALAASFGIWGIADIFRGNTDTSVATVGDIKIGADVYQRQVNNDKRSETQQNNGVLPPDRAKALAQQSLQRMISQTALDELAASKGFVASDDQIRAEVQSIQAFRGPLGTFDRPTFLQLLSTIGYTENSFIDQTRRDIIRSQLMDPAGNGVEVPAGYARAVFLFLNERRAAEYVVLTPDAAGSIANPDDATLAAYIKAHPGRFSTPEYRDVSYAGIGPDDVMNQLTVSDDQLRQAYELQKDKYVIPEKRDVEQITFPDEASAKAARAQIDAGKSFADIAAARGLKQTDIDQGTVTADSLGAERGAAAFAVPVGGVTQPVKFILGWVLIHVTKVTPGASKSFDDVKASLKQDALTALSGDKIKDVIAAFEDALAGGATLAEAAKKVGMHVGHVAAVDQNGLAPDGTKAQLPSAPEFLPQVFKSDVGDEGDPFGTADGHQYVIKVNGDIPPKLKPLDAVRAEATAAWIAERRAQLLADKAKALAAEANASHSIAAVAASLHLTPQSSGMLLRDTATPALPKDLVTSLFHAPAGGAVYGRGANGSYIVARVTGIAHPPLPLGDPRYQQFVQQLSQQVSSDVVTSFAQAARDKEGVVINQQQVDQALGNQGS